MVHGLHNSSPHFFIIICLSLCQSLFRQQKTQIGSYYCCVSLSNTTGEIWALWTHCAALGFSVLMLFFGSRPIRPHSAEVCQLLGSVAKEPCCVKSVEAPLAMTEDIMAYAPFKGALWSFLVSKK